MKTPSNPKDYFLRVYELFALMVPGIIFIYLLVYMSENIGEGGVKETIINLYTTKFAIILGGLVSFVIGHLIAGIGSTFDQFEWWLASKIFSKKELSKHIILDTILPIRNEFNKLRINAVKNGKAIFKDENITSKNIRMWSLAYLKANAAAEIRLELNYHDAHRRSVRNIAVLLFITSCCFSFWIHNYYHDLLEINVLLLLLTILGWHRHQHIQWKYTELVFLYFATTKLQKDEEDSIANNKVNNDLKIILLSE